ncbi:MAG: hypothetical protein Q9181_007758, partial [Wetmoreana brouardii]
MASQAKTPASPSGLFFEPRSPNSWTARSFTTLRPSNSPSQIFFPQYSQASLLLAPKTDDVHTIKPQRKSAATQKQSQQSFVYRNRIIISAVVLQLSLIVLTITLVLVITAATSKPPKHIKPGYYVGSMLSSATGFASIVVLYVNCKERKKSEANHPPDEVNDPELTLPPFTSTQRDFNELRAVVSNWESAAPPNRLRSIMTSRPQPSASARVAGSNNRVANVRVRAFITENQGIEMQSLPAPQQPRPDSTDTALELQRFLDHELQRQEAIKRRINSWLEDISATQESLVRPHRRDSLPQHPSARQLQVPQLQSPPPQRRQTPHTSSAPAFPRILPNPARLAEIDAEIEAYLGIPPPPLPIVSYPPSPSIPSKLALSLPPARPPPPLPRPPRPSSTASLHATTKERHQDVDNGIDYSVLPPAIPRPGAKGRDPVLSDPITVVHIGPEDPAAKHSKPASKLRDDDHSATSSDEIEKSSKLAEAMQPGKATMEEVDDFAE